MARCIYPLAGMNRCGGHDCPWCVACEQELARIAAEPKLVASTNPADITADAYVMDAYGSFEDLVAGMNPTVVEFITDSHHVTVVQIRYSFTGAAVQYSDRP